MADREGGAVSARVDLNLNLAPPWDPNAIGVNMGLREESSRDESSSHPARRILPRFGPGIHGVYLDLVHHENEAQPGGSVLAEVRGFSPSSSNEQALVHGSVREQHSAMSQETVEQLSEQTETRNVIDMSEDSQASQPFPLEFPLRFRRYVQPVHPGPDRLEDIPNQSLFLDRFVDVVEDEPKEKSCDSGKGDKVTNAGNYECNVCLEMALEPVLTSCGHLFCWPCLYQWLYIHSEDEECPVCKGSVSESDIIPIYGRGDATFPARHPFSDCPDFVPPRPHARRTESFRQRLGRWDLPAEEPRDNVRGYMWRFNEALRIRAFHFPQEVIEGARDFRARAGTPISERRENLGLPTVESLFRPPADEAIHTFGSLRQAVGDVQEALHRRVAFLSDHLQDDLMRRLAVNRSEIEDRLALLRARLTNLSGDVDSHRTISAAISVSGILIPSITAINSPRQNLQEANGVSMLEEVASPHRVESDRQGNQGTTDVVFARQRVDVIMRDRSNAPDTHPSEYVDVDVESSHGRKRRRLN
ncbi:hypothetical protein O6H91_02G139800 [Diphasiastrum complanatum]|uniref:Uncharacterized protein n=3 Tax=Diphasiastrum complanatum TaxID=34168 RepID=A0ACC2EL90_DIPCM|nr:hypothetical protein O6H91_02G139800 [Diphasiastrum complanatum]